MVAFVSAVTVLSPSAPSVAVVADCRFGVFYGDGLTLVGDVRVDRDLYAVMAQRLERHQFGAVQEVCGVKGEDGFHGTVWGVRRERGLGGDGIAVPVQQALFRHAAVLVRALHMEGAGERVFLAGDEVRILHRIHDGGLRIGGHGLVAVRAVRGGGADLWGDDAELLVHVVLVLVLRDEGAVAHAVQLLEHGDGPAAQAGGGQGRFHDLIAVRSLCGELVDGGDGLIVPR